MKAPERGRIVLWNEAYAVMFGIPVGQAVGETIADVLSPESAKRIEELDREMLASPMEQEISDLIMESNVHGHRVAHVIRTPIFDARNEVEYIVSIVRDITDEQARMNEIRLASKVFETTADAIVITDADDHVVMVNSAFSKLTGFTPDDMLGRLLSESPFRPIDPIESATRMERLHREGSVTGEVLRVHKDGSELVLWVTATCARDAGGRIINYVRVFTNISALKDAQRKLEQVASFDALTNLPNRRLFNDRLNQALLRASRSKRRVGLLFLDLDKFKEVNDTLGHDIGDQLLREVAVRLEKCVRGSDSLCRLGGDEFTIVVENATLPVDAIRVAERIVQALVTPFVLSGHEVKTTVSVGVAIYPDDGTEAATLIKNADVAMYRAKHGGGNRYELFSTSD
jgi:diguanylate cyclase (GGDEF)-like protein/PAS domain S-box-containing protein